VDLLIAKDDLHRCRVHEAAPAALAEGQARLRIDAFGLTSNNITYAEFGERMSYWNFFPTEEGWGRMPVWGFAEVAESRQAGLEEGARVYGYLPPSTELVVAPARVDRQGFTDGSAHRASLPRAYNGYLRVDADPAYDPREEDRQMLLRPLFATSYLIDDFLQDSGLLSAGTVLLSSASSKTASALAFLLSRRPGIEVVGLTSARSSEFVRELDVYTRVAAYGDVDSLPQTAAVYVDMAGDAQLRNVVHGHFRERLAHSSVVGATHHDSMGALPAALPGPRPVFFFAPDRVVKRTGDWGREGLESRLAEAWDPYLEWTAGWLEVLHASGPRAVERTYLDLLDGHIDPARAHVLSMTP
jgi:hypothetical protein